MTRINANQIPVRALLAALISAFIRDFCFCSAFGAAVGRRAQVIAAIGAETASSTTMRRPELPHVSKTRNQRNNAGSAKDKHRKVPEPRDVECSADFRLPNADDGGSD